MNRKFDFFVLIIRNLFIFTIFPCKKKKQTLHKSTCAQFEFISKLSINYKREHKNSNLIFLIRDKDLLLNFFFLNFFFLDLLASVFKILFDTEHVLEARECAQFTK